MLEIDTRGRDPALVLSNLRKSAHAIEFRDRDGEVHQVGSGYRFHLKRVGTRVALVCHAEVEDEFDGAPGPVVGCHPVVGEVADPKPEAKKPVVQAEAKKPVVQEIKRPAAPGSVEPAEPKKE